MGKKKPALFLRMEENIHKIYSFRKMTPTYALGPKPVRQEYGGASPASR